MKQDVAMLIVPEDFPDIDSSIVETLIREMRNSYTNTAEVAAMTFDRSVLGREARVLTRDMIDKFLGLLN